MSFLQNAANHLRNSIISRTRTSQETLSLTKTMLILLCCLEKIWPAKEASSKRVTHMKKKRKKISKILSPVSVGIGSKWVWFLALQSGGFRERWSTKKRKKRETKLLWEARKQDQIYHTWHVIYEIKRHLVFVPTSKITSYAQTMNVIISTSLLFPKYLLFLLSLHTFNTT